MARRRLTKKQKIAIAVGVTAAAGITAAVLMRRRDGAPGGQGYPGTPPGPFVIPGYLVQPPGLTDARRRLCMNPNNLTTDQMTLLIDNVFIPIMEALGRDAAGTSPESQEEFYGIVAEAAVKQTCGGLMRPKPLATARVLAYGAWLKWNGLSGNFA